MADTRKETRVAKPIVALAFMLTIIASAKASALPLDPDGYVEITWDVLPQWTTDGYVAEVRIQNRQLYRQLNGWYLGFTWNGSEIIYSALGAQASEQGNCANVTLPGAAAPHSCLKTPTMKDLLPTAEASLQVANCCQSGVLLGSAQDANSTLSTFQMTIGNAATNVSSLVPPVNFTLMGDAYTCTSPVIANSSKYDVGGRNTECFRTYKVKCTYVQAASEITPGCCVSLSTFYNSTVSPCATCACACGNFGTDDDLCDVESPLAYLLPAPTNVNSTYSPNARECSADGCPVSIHWHVQASYQGYFVVLLTITNRLLFQSYANWTLTVNHPDMNNITSVDNFGITSIMPYGNNDTAVLYGIPYVSNSIVVAPGYVQATLLIGKDSAFTFADGYAFPRGVNFNGQTCVMPTWYPTLPSAAFRFAEPSYILTTLAALILSLVVSYST